MLVEKEWAIIFYKITLNDGTELKNIKLNGNNFISEEIIDDSIFNGNLDNVIISNENTSEIHAHMVLMSNRIHNGCSWFVLADKSLEQLEKEAYWQAITDLEINLMRLKKEVHTSESC